jgi:thiol-disulfide isomerase/thioredoxin
MARPSAILFGNVALALALGCNSQSSPMLSEVEKPPAANAQAPDDVSKAGDLTPLARKLRVYDIDADGSAQIAEALQAARSGDKRVLLQFGAEWCGWCHKLHHLFADDQAIADVLAKNYIVVLIDVDGDHNAAVNEKYGNPMQHGLPVLVVLDSDGTQLTTQETGQLEEGDHHDPELVLAFLNKWLPGATASSDAADSATTFPAGE